MDLSFLRPLIVLGLASFYASAQVLPVDDQPRQSALDVPGCGKVHFPIRCTLPENQRFFDQGIAHLHGYSFFEAERCFRQITATEPDIAMAYWGMAMANVDFPDRAADFIELALPHRGKASERERVWIDILAKFYEVTTATAQANKERKKTVEYGSPLPSREFTRPVRVRADILKAGFGRLVESDPTDIEAAAFMVERFCRNRALGAPIANPSVPDGMLDKIFAKNPDHPAHHYRVQLWLGSKPERAATSAATCGRVAPAIAHQWRIGGDLFSALHRHRQAVRHFDAAMRVEHSHMARFRLMPYRVPEYAATVRALSRSLILTGDARGALALGHYLIGLPRHPKYNRLGDPDDLAGIGPELLVETCRVYQMLDELRKLEDSGILSTGKNRHGAVRVTAGLATAYLEMGDLERGKARMRRVVSLRADAWDTAAAKWIDSELRVHRALLAVATGRREEARKQLEDLLMKGVLMQSARAADLFLALGERNHAIDFCVTRSRQFPNRVPLLARQIYIAHSVGSKDLAKKTFERLRREVPASCDLSVPLFARLSGIAKEFGYQADWRLPGVKPAVKRGHQDLGPSRWIPKSTRTWNLLAANGKNVALEKYRGKPVVIILYLGFGCLHCVEQLREFHPHVGAFRRAGLEILAIGTDTPKNMREAVKDLPAVERFAYTMLSDRKMRVFREWVAFDFFARSPMHGTFLLDKDGKVIWQDISHAPFSHPEWFLAECERLLKAK